MSTEVKANNKPNSLFVEIIATSPTSILKQR